MMMGVCMNRVEIWKARNEGAITFDEYYELMLDRIMRFPRIEIESSNN